MQFCGTPSYESQPDNRACSPGKRQSGFHQYKDTHFSGEISECCDRSFSYARRSGGVQPFRNSNTSKSKGKEIKGEDEREANEKGTWLNYYFFIYLNICPKLFKVATIGKT
jgi:hypothetical protein